jgi:hypothetical protein
MQADKLIPTRRSLLNSELHNALIYFHSVTKSIGHDLHREQLLKILDAASS